MDTPTALVSAEKAQDLLDGATPGPWSVSEMHDGAAAECELGVVALDDPRSAQKPDGTWHAAIIARGMDGPTRESNAALIVAAPDLARTVIALAAELARAREDNDIVHAGRNVVHGVMERRIATVEAERDRAREAVLALTAIIEGRTTAPTDEEIAALHAAGGRWLVCTDGWTPVIAVAPRHVAGQRSLIAEMGKGAATRWIALDADGRPCAWPVVEAPSSHGENISPSRPEGKSA